MLALKKLCQEVFSLAKRRPICKFRHMEKYVVAIVGATGMVGEVMIRVLEERKFPVKELILLASEGSRGKKVKFCDADVSVQALSKNSFKGVDFALFSAGAAISLEYAPIATKAGAIVIDNTSAFRMEKDVPLVVPEVNGKVVQRSGIIANPNCSTIQLVCVLKPIHDAARIRRVIVATYQAVSGAGREAVEEFRKSFTPTLNPPPSRGRERDVVTVFPHPIAFNCIPHIDVFEENGYTKEEMKVVRETKKIMNDDSIAITCTAVRVPVFTSHSEAVTIETEKRLSAVERRRILSSAPGVIVVDNPSKNEYPLAMDSEGKDDVFVGRIREDTSCANGINLWIVSDNLRKGAATNAVQIAELLAK